MSEPIVVEVTRSGFVESRHLVDCAVVDSKGTLIASAGEPNTWAAFRSSAKPIQARVALEAGWIPPDQASLAVACASHNGQPRHVEQVRAILEAAGVSEGALRCPVDVPAYPDAALAVSERARIYHNCSGKHASMLATCVANGWALDSYMHPGHPLQEEIRRRLSRLEINSEVLVDGCGVPTYSTDLATLASAFMSVDDGGVEQAAMRAHPFLVGGSERFDTDLMTVAPHILVKSGAEGLCCMSAGGFGIALKSRDGFANRARGPAALLVLRELSLVDDNQLDKLSQHREVPVLGGGVPVGSARAKGGIARH